VYKRVGGIWVTDWDSDNIDDRIVALDTCIQIEEDLLTRNFDSTFETYKEVYKSIHLLDQYICHHQYDELVCIHDESKYNRLGYNEVQYEDHGFSREIKVERDFSGENIVIHCSQIKSSYQIRAKWITHWSSESSDQSLRARRVCAFIEEDLRNGDFDPTFRKYNTGYPMDKDILLQEEDGYIVINYSRQGMNRRWVTDWKIDDRHHRFIALHVSRDLYRDLLLGDFDPTFEKYKERFKSE